MSETPKPDDPRSDRELIDAANGGDPEAFEALYDRYRAWVLNLAFRFTRNRTLALDVMQEVFLYWLRKFPDFELTAQVKTFLYPVVRHLSISQQQKSKRLSSTEVDAMDFQESTKTSIFDTADLAALASLLQTLPEAQREVLILHIVDELTLSEVAHALQIPPGTAKSRLHHALKTLREDERAKKYFQID